MSNVNKLNNKECSNDHDKNFLGIYCITTENKHLHNQEWSRWSKRKEEITEYCSMKPENNSLGIAIALRRSSKVSVIPIPSIVRVMPMTVHWGLTQLNELGFTNPNKQPRATHKGKAVDIASPTASIELFFAVSAFDELPQRTGYNLNPEIWSFFREITEMGLLKRDLTTRFFNSNEGIEKGILGMDGL